MEQQDRARLVREWRAFQQGEQQDELIAGLRALPRGSRDLAGVLGKRLKQRMAQREIDYLEALAAEFGLAGGWGEAVDAIYDELPNAGDQFEVFALLEYISNAKYDARMERRARAIASGLRSRAPRGCGRPRARRPRAHGATRRHADDDDGEGGDGHDLDVGPQTRGTRVLLCPERAR